MQSIKALGNSFITEKNNILLNKEFAIHNMIL